MSGEARAQVQAALEELVGAGALGAGVVGRDGLPILLRLSRPVLEETFSAMAAAMLGAAEAALLEFGTTEPASITVDAGRLHLVVAALDDQHLLVVAAPAGGGKPFDASVEQARTRLRSLLGG